MPYISLSSRARVDRTEPISPGELNYAITMLLVRYLRRHTPLSYLLINDIIGALDAAKLEFVRRIVGPYENVKIDENGDVYDHDTTLSSTENI